MVVVVVVVVVVQLQVVSSSVSEMSFVASVVVSVGHHFSRLLCRRTEGLHSLRTVIVTDVEQRQYLVASFLLLRKFQ